MGSAAKGPLKSSWARWIKAFGGSWHAYAWDWKPEDHEAKKVMPVCGALLPRKTAGRGSTPPSKEDVCPKCAYLVGFRRRPLTSATMRAKRGPSAMSFEDRIGVLERAVAALQEKLGP